MESDTFFEYLKEHDPERKYDVVFIDGLHKSYQVKRDIENSLEVLSPNGYILLHDCNPPTSHMARENYRTEYGYEPWNGTVWKAIYQLRTTRNFYLAPSHPHICQNFLFFYLKKLLSSSWLVFG